MKSGISTIAGYRRPLLAAAACLLGTGLLCARSAAAETLRYPDIMPVSQVKEGMVGYGLTTFHGTTISRFEVKVIGIIKNANVGRDLILIRMHGGPITERGANLIQGMSGSPIYINGKLIGAFSQGEAFPKEPVGKVTPIEDMLEDWDPKIPQSPDYFKPADKSRSASGKARSAVGRASDLTPKPEVVTLREPIRVGSRSIDRLVLNAPMSDPRRSDSHLAVLHPATTYMTAGNLSERDRKWLQDQLDRKGYAVTVVAGASPSSGHAGFIAKPLRAGSCFGTFLATGDSPFGGFGTITYRRGNRILGFGHPLFSLGPLEAAITSAYVVDVFSGLQVSHIIAIPGDIVGVLRQDRDFAVAGDIGRQPQMLPFDITVNDSTNHRSQTFHTRIFQHPDLTPMLLGAIVRDAVGRVHDIPGDVMARVTTTVDAAEVGAVTRTNHYFDSTDISSAVGQDLGEITNIVSGNPFYPLPIRSAHMTVDISEGHNTATVERIFLKQGRYEPGDTMEIGVVLKPYRRDPIVKNVPMKIPADTPTGRYQLAVRGGVVPQFRLGGLVIGNSSPDGPQSPPANVRQMVSRLNEHETNTDVVARLVLNSVAPSLEGEKLSQLPPNLAALMRSDRNSGVRLEREEVRTIQPAGYVTSGIQQLVVTIVRKNTLEPSGPGGTSTIPTGPPSTQPLPGLPSVSGGQLANPAEDTDAQVTERQNESAYQRLFVDPLFRPWMAAMAAAPPDKQVAPRITPSDAKPAADTQKPAAPPPAGPQTAPAAPAAPPADTANDKPVGRQLQVWRQVARADFAAGKFTSTSVAANGALRIAPTLQRLATTTETYIWSMASDEQGNLYAGTGTSGKIFRITSDKKLTELVALPIVAVQSLVYSAHDKVLYAGSAVKGNVYRVSLDGSYRLIAHLPERYVLAMIVDDSGNLFIGAGGGGAVYRVSAEKLAGAAGGTRLASDTPAMDHLTPFVTTPADHVMALTLDHQNNLYVGTGNNGIVYKVTPDGKANVLFDAKENSITGLAVDKDNTVYAVTGPRGILYRLTADGGATTLFDRSTAFYTGLKIGPDGTLYATTVNAVFHFLPSDTDPNQPIVVPFDNPKDVDFLSLVVLPDGSVAAGTGNIGEVYGVGPRWSASGSPADSHSGDFVSVVHDAKLRSQWGMARWEAATPKGSSIRIETRTGNAAEPDATWSSWSPVSIRTGNEGAITSPPARFIQYRIHLESSGAEQPSVREVSLSYLPKNQPPRVAFASPAGGERWAKSQTIRWNAADPDGDTLTYELFYSDKGGTDWHPLPLQGHTGPGAGQSGSTSLDEFQKQLNEKNIPDAVKQSLLENFRRRMASGAGSVATRDTSKSWDTSSLPDGTYVLKVVASDRISNPTDPLSTRAVSEPFTIVNELPKVTMMGEPHVEIDKTVTIQGMASQKNAAISAVQVRIDGGEWMAAAPKDGLFDGPDERFSFHTAPLATGKHTIEVEVFNTAGQKSTARVETVVP